MGQVSVHIGGRSYAVACTDGDEPRVARLAQYIDRKADDLNAALGQMSEPRLLFMAALMITDELFELREGGAAAPAAPGPAPSAAAIEALAARIDSLAANLEGAAASRP